MVETIVLEDSKNVKAGPSNRAGFTAKTGKQRYVNLSRVEAKTRFMRARKTIKAKILELRRGKEELLKREYEGFQRYLHGDKSVPLYSATKQQAETGASSNAHAAT